MAWLHERKKDWAIYQSVAARRWLASWKATGQIRLVSLYAKDDVTACTNHFKVSMANSMVSTWAWVFPWTMHWLYSSVACAAEHLCLSVSFCADAWGVSSYGHPSIGSRLAGQFCGLSGSLSITCSFGDRSLVFCILVLCSYPNSASITSSSPYHPPVPPPSPPHKKKRKKVKESC